MQESFGKGKINNLTHRAESLLYPYYVFGILIIIYNTLLSIIRGDHSLIAIGKRILALYGNYIWDNNSEYIGTLWFLVAMYSVTLIVEMIGLCKKKWKISAVIGFLVVGFTFSIINMWFKFRLPYCFDIACTAFVFYFSGRWFGKVICDKHFCHWLWSLIFLVVGFFLGIGNEVFMKFYNFKITRVDMLYMNYGIFPIFLFPAICISYGFMIAAKLIYEKWRFKFIEHIGRVSLLIMVVHLYILDITVRLFNSFPKTRLWALLSTCILSIGISFFIERYLPILYKYRCFKEWFNKYTKKR